MEASLPCSDYGDFFRRRWCMMGQYWLGARVCGLVGEGKGDRSLIPVSEVLEEMNAVEA